MLVTLHRIAAALVATAMIGYMTLVAGAAAFKIVTASERGTYIQIGRDLARYIAPLARHPARRAASAGSAENVQRLRYEPGVKLALVQSDVYQAFLDQAAAGNARGARPDPAAARRSCRSTTRRSISSCAPIRR